MNDEKNRLCELSGFPLHGQLNWIVAHGLWSLITRYRNIFNSLHDSLSVHFHNRITMLFQLLAEVFNLVITYVLEMMSSLNSSVNYSDYYSGAWVQLLPPTNVWKNKWVKGISCYAGLLEVGRYHSEVNRQNASWTGDKICKWGGVPWLFSPHVTRSPKQGY